MLIKTRGIVFRAIKYSETSLIVDIYTEERGLQKYIVNGVRSPKAPLKAALFQSMSLVELVAYARTDKSLNRIKEIRPAHVYQQLSFDVSRGALGLFITEVARNVIREPEANPTLFALLFQTYLHLDQCETPVNNNHLFFLLELASELGFSPGIESGEPPNFLFDLQEGLFCELAPSHPYHLSPELSTSLWQLLQSERGNCYKVPLTRSERRGLLEGLLTFYRLHIENFQDVQTHLIYGRVFE